MNESTTKTPAELLASCCRVRGPRSERMMDHLPKLELEHAALARDMGAEYPDGIAYSYVGKAHFQACNKRLEALEAQIAALRQESEKKDE